MTHYTYQWEGPLIRRGSPLPELHAWLALPDANEIIDLTTGSWPVACWETLGIGWPGDRPPPYLWAKPDELPERVLYKPELEAIAYVLRVMRHAC